MKYIIGNWKMNPTSLAKAEAFFNELERGLQGIDVSEKKVVVCPPYLYLRKLSNMFLGAQNCAFKQEGAFTGEISAAMLKDAGAEYVIVGHSERRRFFFENNDIVAKKVYTAVEANLTPVLCIGSPTQETDEEEKETIKKQLEAVFTTLSQTPNLPIPLTMLIAYEPVWAIGTGNAASPQQVKEMFDFIKSIIHNSLFEIHYLYGGSVSAQNIRDYTSLENVGGCLVGGASIAIPEFIQLIKNS